MKHKIKLLVPGLALLCLATSCVVPVPVSMMGQGTDAPESQYAYPEYKGVELLGPGHTVSYRVGNTPYTSQVNNESDLQDLSARLIDYARKGKKVEVSNSDTTAKGNVEKVTFTSTDVDKVTAWVASMVKRGYSVTIEYNKKKSRFTCTATRPKSK